MWRVGCLVFAAVVLVVGSGCATDVADSAPIFTVQGQGDPIELSAWTFCHKRMCADGHPPDHPPNVGRPPSVAVQFSEPGWTLTAGFSAPNEDCTREFAVPLTRTDNDPTGRFSPPAPPARTTSPFGPQESRATRSPPSPGPPRSADHPRARG